ncbi:hypothetical protein LguiB_017785 [Lonicera macranthoides]
MPKINNVFFYFWWVNPLSWMLFGHMENYTFLDALWSHGEFHFLGFLLSHEKFHHCIKYNIS